MAQAWVGIDIGKEFHWAGVIALARRRVNVLFAMLRNETLFSAGQTSLTN